MPPYVAAYNGNSSGAAWNNAKGANAAGYIQFGYDTTNGCPIVCFGTANYTIQLRTNFNGGNPSIRTYYADNQTWSDWHVF